MQIYIKKALSCLYIQSKDMMKLLIHFFKLKFTCFVHLHSVKPVILRILKVLLINLLLIEYLYSVKPAILRIKILLN